MVVHFTQPSDQADRVEVEIFGKKDRVPLRPDKTRWQGKYAHDRELGEVVQMDSGWVFALGTSDHPRIIGSSDESAESIFRGRTLLLIPAPFPERTEATN